jgi:hypothetical protein
MIRLVASPLVAFLLASFFVVPSSPASAQQAWQLVEIVDYEQPPADKEYRLTYARGSIGWRWALGNDAWAFVATWSPPPETIRPGDRVTVDFQVVTTQDVGEAYSAGGSFALFFDRPDIEPGSAGAPIGFTNDKGETGSAEVRHRIASPPVARTVWVDASKLGAGRPGARVALIAAAYNGRVAGTKYVYEWRGPLSPEEKKKLLPPGMPARPAAPPLTPAAPPGMPPLRDTGARFSSIRGSVLVYHEGEKPSQARYAKLGTVLYKLDHVIVEEDSSAIIGFADLSTHLVKEESEVVITMPPDKDSKVGLVLGTMWSNIKKMWKDGTMEVEMWDAAASVKGTTLVCESTPQGSIVKVIEGVVEVRSRTRAQSVSLGAGTMVRSSASGLGPVQAFDVAAESASWAAVRTGGRGAALPRPSRTEANLALAGRASQSSTAFNGTASRAIDGNTGGAFTEGSVTHTAKGDHPWWQVDLGRSTAIDRVVIWNRTDCCSERLASFWLLVSDTPLPAGASATGPSTTQTWRRQAAAVVGRQTEIPVGARGRYVRIQLERRDYLSLAEVEVFGR